MTMEDMPGHLIRRLNQISTSVFQARTKDAGFDLTPVQFTALAALSDNPGIDQATLAGLIAYDRATIGGVVDRLRSKGLIRRRVDALDRRARVLDLTDAGVSLLARLSPIVRDLQPDILTGLTAQERAAFVALARKSAAAGNQLSRTPQRWPDAKKGVLKKTP